MTNIHNAYHQHDKSSMIHVNIRLEIALKIQKNEVEPKLNDDIIVVPQLHANPTKVIKESEVKDELLNNEPVTANLLLIKLIYILQKYFCNLYKITESPK